jgi:hypothetical protein
MNCGLKEYVIMFFLVYENRISVSWSRTTSYDKIKYRTDKKNLISINPLPLQYSGKYM